MNKNKYRETRRKLETHWQSTTDVYEERQVGVQTVGAGVQRGAFDSEANVSKLPPQGEMADENLP